MIVVEKATPVVGGSAVTREPSSLLLVSIKHQQLDQWHATCGSPDLSSSGLSLTSSFFMPPPPPSPATEEGMHAWQAVIERSALDNDLVKFQNSAHLAMMAYEVGLNLWKMRDGKD